MPVVEGDTLIRRTVLNGWTNPMHPSYVKLRIPEPSEALGYEADTFSTPFGNQALSVFGYRRGPLPVGADVRGPGGAETTDEILNAILEADVVYTLTFNVAGKDQRPGCYVVQLSAVDSDGTKTELAVTSGVATTNDMSEAGQVVYHASSSSPLGQRISIRLMQGDSSHWRNSPVYDNVKLVATTPEAALAQTIECPFGQTTVGGVVQCLEEGADSYHSLTFTPTGKHVQGRVYLSNTVDGVKDTAVQEGGLRQCGSDSWVLALNSDKKGNICAKMNKNGTLTEWKVIDPTISTGGWRGNKMMRIASLGVPDATTCDQNTRFLYGYEQASDASRWLVEVDGNCEAIESTRQDVTAYTTWPIYQDWVTTSEGAVVWVTAWRKSQKGSISEYFPPKSCTFPNVDAEGYRCSTTRGTLKPHTESSDQAKVTTYYPN